MVAMNGPSLEAIRRFKEQQERKKKEEEEKKIKEKLITLEFRATHGDRKAKQELKRIESIKQNCNKQPELQQSDNNLERRSNKPKSNLSINKNNELATKSKQSIKFKKVETDFDELMKLAKQNTNEIKKPPLSPSSRSDKPKQQERKKKLDSVSNIKEKVPISKHNSLIPDKKSKQEVKRVENNKQDRNRKPDVRPTTFNHIASNSCKLKADHIIGKNFVQRAAHIYNAPARNRPIGSHYGSINGYYRDEDEEDDYEADGFVVDDGDDDAQDELRKTLKSVFRYDRRRCDLREEELDRQYRAIGRVSTFEDLEREERRASRLAAEEDSKALREEEERKRLKKIRLKNS